MPGIPWSMTEIAILAAATLGYVMGRWRAVVVPLALLVVAVVAQQLALASRGHWTDTEAEFVGVSALAVLAALAGVAVRKLQARWWPRSGPPASPFPPLPNPPARPDTINGEPFEELDPITRRAWEKARRRDHSA
jgi:hypothetical protein